MRAHIDLCALVAALRDDAKLRTELAQLLAPEIFGAALKSSSAQPTTFSSRKGCGAPGYAADSWKEIAKQIGVKRGRWFVVSREALDAYERGQLCSEHSATPTTAKTWHPSMAADSRNLRRVGVGR